MLAERRSAMKETIISNIQSARRYLDVLRLTCTSSQLPLIINIEATLTSIEVELAAKGGAQ